MKKFFFFFLLHIAILELLISLEIFINKKFGHDYYPKLNIGNVLEKFVKMTGAFQD